MPLIFPNYLERFPGASKIQKGLKENSNIQAAVSKDRNQFISAMQTNKGDQFFSAVQTNQES